MIAAMSLVLGIAAASMGISCISFGLYLMVRGDWGGLTGVTIGVFCLVASQQNFKRADKELQE